MKILYSDDLFPISTKSLNGSSKKYVGKTIGEILSAHSNPVAFVKQFNAKNNKYGISDEVMIDNSYHNKEEE